MASYVYGWTDDDLQLVTELGAMYGAEPEDLLGLWMSESGINPRNAKVLGDLHYYGLIMGEAKLVDHSMAWPAGTWEKIVTTKPIAIQLQAIAKFWDVLQRVYLKDTVANYAKLFGLSSAGVLYALNFVPGYVAHMKTASQPMIVRDAPDGFYAANPGFDWTNKGYINLRDVDIRVNAKRLEGENAPMTAPLFAAVAAKKEQPFTDFTALFSPVNLTWQDTSSLPNAAQPRGEWAPTVGYAIVASALILGVAGALTYYVKERS